MVADRGRGTDREWVESELRGVQGVFAQHGAQFTEQSQAVQGLQSELQLLREELHGRADLPAMRELADSVVTLKSNIETTWTAHAAAVKTKDQEVAEIVQEMQKMMATAQQAAVVSARLDR